MKKHGRKISQYPGKFYKFNKCGHEGVLPETGNSNDFSTWNKDSSCLAGGYWRCHICDDLYRQGLGPKGLLGWANDMLSHSKTLARRRGHKPPQIDSKSLVSLRKNATHCSDGCGQELKWSTDGNFRSPHLHHNHETGLVYGLTTETCNVTQGYFEKIGQGDPASQAGWLKHHFPEVVKYLKGIK